MSNITQLKDRNGNNIYPITSDRLVLDELGKSIGERLNHHLNNHPQGFDGDYNSLTNKPTIPTRVSQLANDKGYITSADLDTSQNHVHSNMNVLEGITSQKVYEWDNKSTFSGSYNDLTNKPTIPSISGLATETYVNTKVASVVNSAPEALDTLKELSNALGNDPNFATTISTQIGKKADKTYVDTELGKKSDKHDHPYKPSSYVPSWTEITGKPTTFTPSSHTHDYVNYEMLNGTVTVPSVTIFNEA